jgi:protein TonB
MMILLSISVAMAAQAVPAELRSGSISSDDYPASALKVRAEGMVEVRYMVGPGGRVSSCAVQSSSGNAALDSATCSLVQRRFRFRPALDAKGSPTTEERRQHVLWRLPPPPPEPAPAI